MAWLAKRYTVVDTVDILQALEAAQPLPEHAVLITFDDGYRDFREHAWPILQKYRLPVTLFVPTGFADQPERGFWWDRVYAAALTAKSEQIHEPTLGTLSVHTLEDRKRTARILNNHVKSLPHQTAMTWVDQLCAQLTEGKTLPAPIMSWQELRQLSAEGVTIGAHSRSHPLLTRISPEEAHQEISSSLSDLKQQLGSVLPIFCYPAGACNETVRNIAADAGIRLGFTTRLGHNLLHRCDLLSLNRINMTPRTTPALLRARLSPLGAGMDTAALETETAAAGTTALITRRPLTRERP